MKGNKIGFPGYVTRISRFIPKKTLNIGWGRFFSPAEMEKIKAGYVPGLAEKWRFVYENDALYFLRAGICPYQVFFEIRKNGAGIAVDFEVNARHHQHRQESIYRSRELVSRLIDMFLLSDRRSEMAEKKKPKGTPSREKMTELNRRMPELHESVGFGRCFSPLEMDQIKDGFSPRAMEDKWRIVYADGALYFLRSWTGYCVYRMFFDECKNGAYLATHFDINRDPAQYKGEDAERDRELASWLIDVLLLRRERPFSARDASAIEAWRIAGRAILIKTSDDKESD